MRYRLRTLLIVLALGPPLLWVGWTKYEAWRAEQERQRLFKIIGEGMADGGTWQAIRDLSQAPPPTPAEDSN